MVKQQYYNNSNGIMIAQKVARVCIAAGWADKLLHVVFLVSDEVEDVDIVVPDNGPIWVYLKFSSGITLIPRMQIIREITSAAMLIIPAGKQIIVTPA